MQLQIKKKKAGGTITYSVLFDEGDDEIATIDSQTGVLTVNGAGKITIKAVLSGNDNYNESTIEHVLYVKGKRRSRRVDFFSGEYN